MTGPRSEPPMPILTTSVIFLPVAPFSAPERMPSENSPMAASTALTSGITSRPSTMTGVLERLRSAVCSTARSSVMLMISPANIASRFSSTPAALASASSTASTLVVHRAFRIVEQHVVERHAVLSRSAGDRWRRRPGYRWPWCRRRWFSAVRQARGGVASWRGSLQSRMGRDS